MSDKAVMVTETCILWRNLEATLMFHTGQKVNSSQATLRFDEYCENASTHTHTHDNYRSRTGIDCAEWTRCNVVAKFDVVISKRMLRGWQLVPCVRSLRNYESGLLWQLHYSYKCFHMSWKGRTYVKFWMVIFSCVQFFELNRLWKSTTAAATTTTTATTTTA